jgi:hypothetical protein
MAEENARPGRHPCDPPRVDDRVQHGGLGVGLEVLAARAEQRDVAEGELAGLEVVLLHHRDLVAAGEVVRPGATASAVPVRSIVTVARFTGHGCSQTTEPSQKSRTATR